MPSPPRDLPVGQTRDDERGVVNISYGAQAKVCPNRTPSNRNASYCAPKIKPWIEDNIQFESFPKVLLGVVCKNEILAELAYLYIQLALVV